MNIFPKDNQRMVVEKIRWKNYSLSINFIRLNHDNTSSYKCANRLLGTHSFKIYDRLSSCIFFSWINYLKNKIKMNLIFKGSSFSSNKFNVHLLGSPFGKKSNNWVCFIWYKYSQNNRSSARKVLFFLCLF